MKSVKGKRTYQLVESSKQPRFDGDVYKVEGSTDLYVKLLKDCTKAKLQDVQSAMNNPGDMFNSITDEVTDILYSRTSFIGYVFRDAGAPIFEEEKKEDVIKADDYDARKRKTEKPVNTGALESLPVRLLLTVAAAVILALLNRHVLFLYYIGILLKTMSEATVRVICDIGFYGYTSLVVGIILAVVVMFKITGKNRKWSTLPFVGISSLMLLLGIVLTDVLIAVVIALLFGALNLLKMILPTIIVIAVVIMLFKYLLGNIFR